MTSTRMMRTAREGENILYRMYRQMLFGNKAFKELFRALEAGETPILFHCSAGKDRTGVAAMLILLALGASDETICADFVQTNVCRKAEIDALLAGHAEEIAADPSKRMRFCTQAGVDPGAAPMCCSHPGSVRQRGGVSGPGVRPDSRPADAPAEDVSGIMMQNEPRCMQMHRGFAA